MPEQRVAILGLGLIGASLAAALHTSGTVDTLVGYDIDPQAMHAAHAAHFIDEQATDDAQAIHNADVVVLAMPVQGILNALRQVATHAKANALIIDVGSSKTQIVQAMNALPAHLMPIGGHPMAGKRTSGVAAADAGLFRATVFALTPTERTTDAGLQRALRLVATLGAEPLLLSAEAHDHFVALTSHLQRLLPLAIHTATHAVDDERIWRLAAGGYQHMTADLAQPLGFWLDVFQTNGSGLAAALRGVGDQMQQLATLLEAGDAASVQQWHQQMQADWLQRMAQKQQDTQHNTEGTQDHD